MDDKIAADAEDKTIEFGIRTDLVEVVACPGCGVEIETHDIPSFTEIACPQCRTRQTVPARLGHFRLLNVIGTGGMGAVFMAQDDTLSRRVAIKVMLSSTCADPEVLRVFRREAQSAARLNHPHIVQIYSFGEEKGQPYLVMELVSGDKLDEIIESGEPLDPAFVLRVGLEIAEGLAAAQEANLVHGDIKPENILFDERMQAKLVDFGIASMLSSKGAGDAVWGTPFYIAPEKAQRRKADVRSDIYSLGATLYHAIAGKPPFDGEDAVAVIRARFEGPAPSLTELRPGIEPQVVTIVERMMQNDLFLRYPNYTSLVKDMGRYLDTVPESRKAGPPSRRARARKSASSGMRVSGAIPRAQDSAAGAVGGTVAGNGKGPGPGPATASAPTGRKGLVIQKGTITSVPPPPPKTGPQAVIPAGGEDAVRRGVSPKTVAVAIIALLGVFVLLLLAGLGVWFMRMGAESKALDRLFVQAQQLQAGWDALDATVGAAVTRVAERDAEAAKVLATAGSLVERALGRPLVVPDLEPPAPAEAPAPAPAGDTPPAANENAAPEAPAEAAPVPAPAPAGQVEDQPALLRMAEMLFAPARQIRAKWRQAEALRDRTIPDTGALTRETMTQERWNELETRAERRRQDVAAIDALLKECDDLLLEMRRQIPALERDAAGHLEAARRRAEAARVAREEAEAQAARQRVEDAARAREEGEIDYVRTTVEQRRALIDRHDYARAAREVQRIHPDLATVRGQEALQVAVEQLERLEALKQFMIRDLREHKGLRRGLGVGDIVDADETALHGLGGRRVAWEEVTVPMWMNLIVQLLENRPQERSLRAIEHGEQLFNAAIFCIMHGGGTETARAKAATLARLALQRRTALRPDLPRLLPALADEKFE